MMEVPAEIVIEQERYGGYLWFICQPDAAWGVWESCKYTYTLAKDAQRDAVAALMKVHKQQGLFTRYEDYCF